MGYRSWLKDVKSIHDLGEHCYADEQHPTEWDQYMARIDRYDEKWRARLQRDIPVAPWHRQFYGSRLHDSWIRKIERTKRELRIVVHEFGADNFGHCMASILNVPETKAVFPVDLVLKEPNYVNAVRANPEGTLRWTDWESISGGEVPCKGPEFLYDWFYEQNGRIQWVAEMWHWRYDLGTLGPSVYLLVDCAEAVAEDRRAPALARAFGEAVIPLWEDAIGKVDYNDEAHVFWGYDTLRDYIVRRLMARGLTAANFRSPID